jgi:hypothetical protein
VQWRMLRLGGKRSETDNVIFMGHQCTAFPHSPARICHRGETDYSTRDKKLRYMSLHLAINYCGTEHVTLTRKTYTQESLFGNLVERAALGKSKSKAIP